MMMDLRQVCRKGFSVSKALQAFLILAVLLATQPGQISPWVIGQIPITELLGSMISAALHSWPAETAKTTRRRDLIKTHLFVPVS